jgi:hypothetical protein
MSENESQQEIAINDGLCNKTPIACEPNIGYIILNEQAYMIEIHRHAPIHDTGFSR